MPRVPILPTVSPQVGGSPQFGAPRTVPMQDATGEQLQQTGQGVLRAASFVTSWQEHEQNLFDDAKAKEADAIAADVIRSQMYDPKQGYLNTVGKDATGDRRKTAFDTIDQKARQIESSLTNDVQRQMFRQAFDHRKMQANLQADEHQSRQTKVFAIGSAMARADGARVDGNLGLMKQELGVAADLNGYGEDQKKQLLLKGTTDFHSTHIGNLVNANNPTEAASYLEAATKAGEIDPEQQGPLTKLVQTAGIHDRGRKLADWYSATGLPLAGQIQKVRDLATNDGLQTEVMDNAIARLREIDADKRDLSTKDYNAVVRKAAEFAQLNGIKDYSLLPPDMLRDVENAGADTTLKLFFKQGLNYITTEAGMRDLSRAKTDPLILRSLTQAQAEALYRPKLDNKDFEELMRTWRVTNDKASPKDLSQSRIDLWFDAKLMIDGKLNRDGKSDDKQLAQAKIIKDNVERTIAANVVGRAPTIEDYDKAYQQLRNDTQRLDVTGTDPEIDSLVTPTKDQSDAGYQDVPGFGIVPNDRITPEARDQIVAALVKNGITPTKALIAKYYAQGLMAAEKAKEVRFVQDAAAKPFGATGDPEAQLGEVAARHAGMLRRVAAMLKGSPADARLTMGDFSEMFTLQSDSSTQRTLDELAARFAKDKEAMQVIDYTRKRWNLK